MMGNHPALGAAARPQFLRRFRLLFAAACTALVVTMAALAAPASAAPAAAKLTVSISAGTVSSGGKSTVTATLTKGGKAFPHATVAIQMRTAGTTTWKTFKKTKTDSRGRAKASLASLTRNTEVRAVFAGNRTARKATAKVRTIGVKQSIAISGISKATPVRGDRFTISGKVSKGLAGGTVRLERKSGDGWVKVETSTAARDRTFKFTLTAGPAGTRTYRVTSPNTEAAKYAASDSRKVTTYEWFALADSPRATASIGAEGYRFVSGGLDLNGTFYRNSLTGFIEDSDSVEDLYLDIWILDGKCTRFSSHVGIDDDLYYGVPRALFIGMTWDDQGEVNGEHSYGPYDPSEYDVARFALKDAEMIGLGLGNGGSDYGSYGVAGFADAKVLCSTRP